MDVVRAIRQGIDSARHHRKDGEFYYDQGHPLFKPYWEAVVLKSDCRDLADDRIVRIVQKRLKGIFQWN